MNGYKRNILRKYMKDEPQLISGTYCTVAEYFASEFYDLNILSITTEAEAIDKLSENKFSLFKNFNIFSSLDYENEYSKEKLGKYFFTKCIVLKYIKTHLFEHFPLRQYNYMRNIVMENIFFTRVISLIDDNIIFERSSSKPVLHGKFKLIKNSKLSFGEREDEKNLRLYIVPLRNESIYRHKINWFNISISKFQFYKCKTETFTLDYLLTENTLFKFENKFMSYGQYSNNVLKNFES